MIKRRTGTLALLTALVVPMLAACGGSSGGTAEAPTTASAPAAATSAPAAATTAPAVDATAAPAATAASTEATAAAPAATAASTEATAAAPASGQTGGVLKLLWWQAPTILNPHQAQGTKDYDASSVVLEPLGRWNEKGEAVPYLAQEIPDVQNGGVAKDFSTITWKLKTGVKWSDGTPFTADDVVFTYDLCKDPAAACPTSSNFEPIKTVEKVDATTVKITWKAPNPNPYIAFMGYSGMILQKAQFSSCTGAALLQCPANQKPIGTGAYMVQDFKPGDSVIYVKNPQYRDAASVGFDEVDMKGGGDATSAARAVCETGEVDYAWNLQVESAVYQQILQGGKCDSIPSGLASIERLVLNFTNPDAALGDKRSEADQPNPRLGDINVRKAIAMAIDKKTIAEQIYGVGGKPTCNILVSPPELNSPNTKCDLDVEGAKKILEDAGWKVGADGTTREKDGVPLVLTFSTTINPVRQKTQAIVKQNLAAIGISVQLKAVDASVFFSTDVGNPDTFGHFFNDLQMYTNNNDSPNPTSYYDGFTCAQIAAKANEWKLNNNGRYCSKDYDALVAQMKSETDPAKLKDVFIKANDTLVNDGAVIPLIQRATPEGKAKNLVGPTGSDFDSVLWNIATWHK